MPDERQASASLSPSQTSTVEAARALARLARVLERASDELSLAQYRVLSAIASGDERASRIAERLELGRPTISAAVTSLCRNGLLARDEVALDQRATALRLTPTGREALGRIEGAMVGRLDGLLARTPDGVDVRQSLVWLGEAIEEAAAERAAARKAPER